MTTLDRPRDMWYKYKSRKLDKQGFFTSEALSNPHPRQAWNLFAGLRWSPDSHLPVKRFLGCGLLKVFVYFRVSVKIQTQRIHAKGA